jgi:hypothetical protein
MGSDENAKIVSELMECIRAAIVNCQVSSEVQAGSGPQVANEYSLLHIYPAHLANHLPRRRGPVSDAAS